MREILFCAAVIVVAVMLPAAAQGDDFYYCLDSAVHVAISNDFIAVQFDTTRPVPSIGTFQASYPCLSGDEPEHIGRGFWSIPLTTQCGFPAAANEISPDPTVNRVFPVYRTASSEEGLPVTDEITVRFEDDLAIDSALAILAAEGLRFIDSSTYRHNLWYCALEETVKTSPLEYGNRLHERSETRWACAGFRVRPVLFGAPPDPYFVNQYYLQNTGQNGGTVGADINVVPAWDIPLWDSTFRVAVIDNGLIAHTDLPSSRVLAGRDFIGTDPENPATDEDPRPGEHRNHGMACAGIMAASHNDTGVVGVFGTCEIVPVKIFSDGGIGAGETRPVVDAIYYAGSRGARVTSNSWGYRFTEPLTEIQDAIRDVADGTGSGTARSPQAADGVVFVFSAGNWAPSLPVVFPANMPEVIAVGATTKTNARWNYSCTGSALDVMAPSGNTNLNGDQWTVDQLGNNGWNPVITASKGDISDVDYTSKMGGTSGACPQVAGIAALLMARGHAEINHAKPVLKIHEIITRSAIDLGDPGWDQEFGYGRANAYRALLSIIRGDVSNDRWIDNLDLAMLIDMVFFGGHATLDDRTGDWNCNGFVDSVDMGNLIEHVFFGGPPPGICFEY